MRRIAPSVPDSFCFILDKNINFTLQALEYIQTRKMYFYVANTSYQM